MEKKHEYALKIGIKRALLFISDTHVGSMAGLMPPQYTTENGNILKANKGQMKLLEYWEGIPKIMDKFGIKDVLLGGDLIQGLNVKEFGAGNTICELDEQADMAIEVLSNLTHGRRGVQIHSVSGTHYHGSKDTDVEKSIVERLGGKHHGKVWNFQLKGSKKVIHLSHGASNAAIYPEMLAGREILFMKEANADAKLPKFDLLLHGHRHTQFVLDKPGTRLVQNGCWQMFMPSDYSMKQYFKFQPDIGYSVILIDEADRFHIISFTLKPGPTLSDFLEDA